MQKMMDKDDGILDREHGIEKYQFVNKNIVSVIQRDTMYSVYYNIAKDFFKSNISSLVIGGPPSEFPSDDMKAVQITLNKDDQQGFVFPYDGIHIPLGNETRHIVSTCHVLEHLFRIHESVYEAYRVLHIGGFFINIIPNRLYHQHDMSNHKCGERCYKEWTPEECLEELFRDYLDKGKFELVQLDTRQNNFDFDLILRKVK